MSAGIDVHQHLWPEPFLEALRLRTSAPYLRGWTLHTTYEAPYEVDPVHHDPRLRATEHPVRGRILVSMSTPIGVEDLPGEESEPLIGTWRDGIRELGPPYAAWTSVPSVDPDLGRLARDLCAADVAGLQVTSAALDTPARLAQLGPVLTACEAAGRPVLIHPGPVPPVDAPPWWPAVVQYTASLQSAWWSWQAVGRSLYPELRVCFVAGAGLAPLSSERYAARSGRPVSRDTGVFVDTSSHGPIAVGALRAALGDDALVLGSDRPYADPADRSEDVHADFVRALRHDNPRRLLTGR